MNKSQGRLKKHVFLIKFNHAHWQKFLSELQSRWI